VVAVHEPLDSAMSAATGNGTGRGSGERELAVLANEFATVKVSLDTRGNGPRLLVEDLEDGSKIWLSPLELASLCLATPEDRIAWLRVGVYRDERA
jgi:hypothetical protein